MCVIAASCSGYALYAAAQRPFSLLFPCSVPWYFVLCCFVLLRVPRWLSVGVVAAQRTVVSVPKVQKFQIRTSLSARVAFVRGPQEHEVLRAEAVESTLERNPAAFRPKIAGGYAAGAGHRSRHRAVVDPRGRACRCCRCDGSASQATRHHKGCHCKKSGCLKKYCECFQAGILCSDVCKCVVREGIERHAGPLCLCRRGCC